MRQGGERVVADRPRHDHAAQVVALLHGRGELRVQMLVGDECGGAAIAEQVVQLVALGERVDDNRHGVGLEHGPERHDGLDRVVGEYHHAIAARYTRAVQVVGEYVRARLEVTIAQALLAAHQRDLVG